MDDKIVFEGYNVLLKAMRSDKSIRVEIDTSEDQRPNLKDIVEIRPEQRCRITVEPLEE